MSAARRTTPVAFGAALDTRRRVLAMALGGLGAWLATDAAAGKTIRIKNHDRDRQTRKSTSRSSDHEHDETSPPAGAE